MSYAQFERDLYNAFNDLKYILDNPDFKSLFQNVKQPNFTDYINANPKRQKNDEIINCLYEYLINGLDARRAKEQLCVKFKLDYEYINNLTTPYITRFRNDIKPAKAYAAQKLSAAGIKKNKIAALLGISNQTLNKLLSVTNRC